MILLRIVRYGNVFCYVVILIRANGLPPIRNSNACRAKESKDGQEDHKKDMVKRM